MSDAADGDGGGGAAPEGGAAAVAAAGADADDADAADADAADGAPSGGTAPVAPGLVTRLGLAIVHPRWALALAADRRRAGASGSDLLAAIGLVLLATQLHALVAAAWLGADTGAGRGVRGTIAVLAGAVTLVLVVLVACAVVTYAAAGARRELGRAFDLACVAVLPLVLVQLAVSALTFALGVELMPFVAWAVVGFAFGWTGALVVLAAFQARRPSARPFAIPEPIATRGRTIGVALAFVFAVGLAGQARWMATHTDDMRPMIDGGPAPAFTLPRIDDHGNLGGRLALADLAGKPVVLDFWATWCGPCVASMPILDEFARAHPEVAVVTINLDDPRKARRLFHDHGYVMQLLAGDDDVQERYGAVTIPHTVVIDAAGQVRKIGHAGDMDLDETIRALAK